MKRRKALKYLASLIGLGTLTGLYAWKIEPLWLEFIRRKMPIKGLPQHLNGKTLMQLSDLHVGNRFDYNYLIKSLKQAQIYNPDIVVYTGDYVSYEGPQTLDQLKVVAPHLIKGKLGTAAILGNHDYGRNWSEENVATNISDILSAQDIDVLRNEKTNIGGLDIIGIDDFWGTNFHPAKALNQYNAEKPSLVLCHNPDVCDIDVWQDYKGWILSGHTHGGQCKPPFLPAPLLPVKNKRYAQGHIDLGDGRDLYINRALGHLWQVRFNVRPEITIFTLESE